MHERAPLHNCRGSVRGRIHKFSIPSSKSHRAVGFALLLAGLTPCLRADATIRYHTDIQTTSLIPAGTLDQALGGLRDFVIRIKGNKAYSSQGDLTTITDLSSRDLILVDPAHKRFATVASAQYAQQVKAAVPAVPEEARAALASMKANLESRSTGRTVEIQGIQAEEHDFVLTVDMALPGGPAPSTPFMKMVMQVWTAKTDEAQRVPALEEFRKYSASAISAMNPGEMIKQVLSAMPGLGDSLTAMMEEKAMNGALALRTHMELSMPFLAAVSQQLPGQTLPAGLDPNAPLMQMTQEIVELSASPVDDANFQVPANYQPASLEEILKGAASAADPPQFKQ